MTRRVDPMKPLSRLDRVRQELALAEDKLASMLKAKPHYSGILETDVERLTEQLRYEEEQSLKAFRSDICADDVLHEGGED